MTAYRAMGSSVYDGTSGIGLFLAQLAALTGDPIIRATSEAALAQAQCRRVRVLFGALGNCTMLHGVRDAAWAGRACCARPEGDVASRLHCRLDIVNGSAGLIPALLDSTEREQSEELLHAAILHGEHLMNLAARTSQGWSWDTLGMPNERHLLGFAHGASGVAYALAALCAATGNQDFLDGAREALRYERAHFRPAAGNWPDLRSFVQPTSTGEQPCMVAWCHVAPGIGFARLLLNKLIANEPQVLAEAEVAICTTAATLGEVAPGTGNLSLCHGDGGNAELLILGADLLNRPELRQIAETAGNQALSRFEETGMPWPCGIPNAGESPNLLLGLAGVGYFFLRLYDSRKTPTVLVPAAQI